MNGFCIVFFRIRLYKNSRVLICFKIYLVRVAAPLLLTGEWYC